MTINMIQMPPDFTVPRRWWHWAVAVLAADVIWFCSMYPVVPKTVSAAALEALLPLPLLIYAYVAASGVLWISRRPWSRWTRQSLGAAIALSAGAVAVWMVDWAIVHTSAEYGYFMIRRL